MLQVLFHLPLFQRKILGSHSKNYSTGYNSSAGLINSNEMNAINLIKKIKAQVDRNDQKELALSIKKLKKIVGNGIFDNDLQHDAHEFFTELILLIHQELEGIKTEFYVPYFGEITESNIESSVKSI